MFYKTVMIDYCAHVWPDIPEFRLTEAGLNKTRGGGGKGLGGGSISGAALVDITV